MQDRLADFAKDLIDRLEYHEGVTHKQLRQELAEILKSN